MERYIVDLFSNDNTGFLKKPIATKTAGTKAAGTKAAGTKAAGTKAAGAKAAGTKAAGTKTAGTKTAGTKTAPKKTPTKAAGTKKPSNNLVKELEINQVAGGESVNNSQCSASPTQCVDSYASCSQTGGR